MRPKSWDMRSMRTDLEESLPRSLSVGQTRSGHKDGVLGDFLVFSVNSAALEQLGPRLLAPAPWSVAGLLLELTRHLQGHEIVGAW